MNTVAVDCALHQHQFFLLHSVTNCNCFFLFLLQTGTKLTAAQKSLAKVDKKGMKSISSFFGGGAKKTKKK